MDELQILIKAIMAENSEQNLDSDLRTLTKRLSDAHKISLKVGIDPASVKTVKSELQTIAKQVQSASTSSKSGSGQVKVFDKTQLEADGQKYFNYVRNIVARVQKEFGKMGQVDVTNVFKNAKGEIQSFTASVTKADGVVEKFNFELAKIKNGSRNLSGFVQTNSILSDKRAGSDLEKTLNFLNRIDNKIADISSKTLKNTSKPLLSDMEQYSQYQKKLDEVKARIEEIKKANATLSGDHKREIASMVADLQRYAKELQKSAYAATDLNAATFQNKKSELQAALKTDIQKWQDSGIFGGKFAEDVNNAKKALDAALDPTALETYKHQLSLIIEQFKQLKLSNTASGRLIDAGILNKNIQTAQDRILNLRKTYSAFLNDPDLVAKWEALFESSKIVDSKKKLQELNASIRNFEQELILAGKHQKSFFDELKTNAVKMGTWMILGGVIAGITRGVTGLYGAVVELDSAMTELKKVTDETDEAYNRFLTDAAEKAVKIGTTYSDYVNSTASFARLGYTIGDAANLAEVANIYAVVGDEISGVDEATASIISTMKAFGIEAENAMTIVDKFNEVGNNFAISSGGIGDAMQRSAAALAAANNTIDQSIALIVAANNVVQDPETVGTMWKTVSMRIRGAKTELEEAGLETEYMAESVATLRKQIKGLTNVNGTGGFDIMLDENTFKSTYDIILGISKVWKNMSDIDQSALLELLAGKRQGNALAATLTNMKDAEATLKKSVASEGSALKEHEKVMDGIQAKQKAFQAQYQALANSILNSDLIKGTFDTGTGLLGWLTKLTDLAGGLPVALAAIVPIVNKMQMVSAVTKEDGSQGIQTIFGAIKSATENDIKLLDKYNERIKDLGISSDDLRQKQIIWNDTIGKGTNRLKHQIDVSDQAVISSDAYKRSIGGTTLKLIGLEIKAKAAAIGVQILNTALNMLIGMAVGLAINAIASYFISLANAEKEARDAAIEAGDAAASLSDEIIDLTGQYIDLCEAVKTDTSAKEDLLKTQENLLEKLGIEKNRVQELVQEYGNLTDAIKAASLEKLNEAERDLRGGLSAKKEALFDVAKPSFFTGFSMNHIAATWDKQNADVNQKALQALVDKGMISASSYGSLGMETWLFSGGKFDPSTIEGVINSYERLGAMMDIVSDAAGSDNAVYKALYEAYNKCSDAVNGYRNSITSLNDNLAQQYMLQGLIGKEVPATKEDFDAYRQSVIDAAVSSGQFIGTNEEIAASVDGVLKSQSRFSSFFADELNDAGGAADYYQAQLSALSDTVASLSSSYAALKDAQEEMAKGEGLSAKTIKALAAEEENYLDYLYEENGVVKLNTEAWKENADAKMLSDISEIQKEIDSINEKNIALRDSIKIYDELEQYYQLTDEAKAKNIDLSRKVYGNIDTNNRQLLEWTEDSLNAFQNAIESWGMTVDELKGSFSTVLGSYSTFDDIDIAFSPILQTADGPVLLDADTVYEYIWGLIDKAGENWTKEDLIRLDAEGLERDGRIIKGLLADIGDTAAHTSEAMHFTGDTGAVATAWREVKSAADAAGVSVDNIGSQYNSVTTEIESNNARIRENQNLLSVYSGIYDSITGNLTEYSQALKSFEDVALTIDSVTDSYTNLAKLQNEVANGFTLSIEKALEYAKVYPKILEGATATANGELVLNETVVNSFIAGQKTMLTEQIDKQIAQLEADKAVLMAKKEFSQAQLELAQAVGTGEGQISKEVAEYRINATNAMVQAMVDAGMDEVTAYKLAAAAMSQNIQEFQRIAYQVCVDTEGNFNAAAYSAAMAMYNNANSMQGNLAAVAAQAHETAYAIAAMASGNLAGTASKVGGLSGGSYGSGISLNLAQGSFNGADYTYTPKQISLDDYISQLQLDISGYTDAIAQIDGQIAILQALKNTPFEKFQNLVNNGSGSSGGANKAEEATKLVEEYISSLGEYYLALKKLEEAQERRKSLEKKLEHTDDFSEKIYLSGELIGAYEAEAESQRNLMSAKQATIIANVGALRNLGFDVDYDSATNKLLIKNLEHLNELTASTTGEYDTLEEATNALRKDTEDLINTTERLNSENIDAKDTIEDLGYQVLETKKNIVSYIEEIYKEHTEAYRKIIDQRKELIQSAKDEYDYESDVADKVKEIADLQARIDQLSLDDSRSALAERRALEEELAKLQSDLSKTQADHSTDAQLDALDKMADDYEQTVEEDIEKLKQTVNSTSDVWNAFYDTILGNNVSVGDSIDAEIVDAWLRAAQAVQTYGTSVNSLPGISTTVAALPKYHDGGVVAESNLGNKELLAVLEEGEIVFTHAQLVDMIENARNGVQGVLESIVQNLVGSTPAVSNVMNSIANDNSKTDNSSEVISPHIEINFTHSGFMSEADMKKYGKQAAEIAIGEINEAFRRSGIINNRNSRLRPG